MIVELGLGVVIALLGVELGLGIFTLSMIVYEIVGEFAYS